MLTPHSLDEELFTENSWPGLSLQNHHSRRNRLDVKFPNTSTSSSKMCMHTPAWFSQFTHHPQPRNGRGREPCSAPRLSAAPSFSPRLSLSSHMNNQVSVFCALVVSIRNLLGEIICPELPSSRQTPRFHILHTHALTPNICCNVGGFFKPSFHLSVLYIIAFYLLKNRFPFFLLRRT